MELKFCWMYITNMFLKFRVIDGEYIVEKYRNHAYKVILFFVICEGEILNPSHNYEK